MMRFEGLGIRQIDAPQISITGSRFTCKSGFVAFPTMPRKSILGNTIQMIVGTDVDATVSNRWRSPHSLFELIESDNSQLVAG